MTHKTITVKASATLASGAEFKEYEYPIVSQLLNDGWFVKDVFQSTTNQNVGFVFFTFVLVKQ